MNRSCFEHRPMLVDAVSMLHRLKPESTHKFVYYNRDMLEKAYDAQAHEDRIYGMWEESGVFKADATSAKESFTISMPPPNATGQLHLGHAVMLALQDIFIRFARMNNKEALWIPGTDHAAIATEAVVIRQIQKEENIPDPRAKLGREELIRRIAEFVEKSQSTIRSQIRKMGSSCDWSRERYTMDPILHRAVNAVFFNMHRDGLIYRGERVVNWDIALQTTISDDEIEHEEVEGTLYTIEYLTKEMTGGEPVFVATSRPETKLGDTALVVHPDDKRYAHLVGKTFDVTWPQGNSSTIAIIADHTADPEFGTGVIGLTPFHSKIDYEIWQRHKDKIPARPQQIIGEDGRMTAKIKGYSGMKVLEAREAFVEDLRNAGRMYKEEKYTQSLSVSYRSKKTVEPLPKLQWFIDVNKKAVRWKDETMSLKEVMQNVVKAGDIKIIPERFEKTYFHWIDNLQDWCISRQIWWGHRIPAWHKHDEIFVGPNAPDENGWSQDSDTLDTWFSSGLWTWSTLLDPSLANDGGLSLENLLEKSPDFQKFHPTSVMETGYDILFFWVARMILMTTYATGQVPFKTVYLHGLIRTREGKKMSKSHPETMIDPLDIIPKYGADALRLSMIVGQSAGNDSKLYEEKIAGYRNFVNKLWNASRFVLMQCEQAKLDPHAVHFNPKTKNLSLADRAVLSVLQEKITAVTTDIGEYRLSEAGENLYRFIWDYFCDWYLELSKDSANIEVLVHVLRQILVLLHPYCPFVTEALWAEIKPLNAGMLIRESWPVAQKKFIDNAAAKELKIVIDVIGALRQIRSEQEIEAGKKTNVVLVARKYAELLESEQQHIVRLGRIGVLTIQSKPIDKSLERASVFLEDVEVHMLLAGLVDTAKLKESLSKEQKNLETYVKTQSAKLNNSGFTDHAPQAVVAAEREKLTVAQEKLQKIEERLKTL